MSEATSPDWGIIGMTVDEAAEALRVERRAVLAAIAERGLPAVKIGRGWRIDPDALKAWIAKGQPVETEGQPLAKWQVSDLKRTARELTDGRAGMPSAFSLIDGLCCEFGVTKLEDIPSYAYESANQWMKDTINKDGGITINRKDILYLRMCIKDAVDRISSEDIDKEMISKALCTKFNINDIQELREADYNAATDWINKAKLEDVQNLAENDNTPPDVPF